MKRRTPTLSHPRRHPYVRAELEDLDRVLTFRLPTLGQAQATLATEDGNAREQEGAIGRLLGMAWADEELELEADPEDGLAVFDELYEAGCRQDTLLELGAALLDQIHSSTPKEEEVAARVRFFGVNNVERTSSGSGGNTSDGLTPTPS